MDKKFWRGNHSANRLAPIVSACAVALFFCVPFAHSQSPTPRPYELRTSLVRNTSDPAIGRYQAFTGKVLNAGSWEERTYRLDTATGHTSFLGEDMNWYAVGEEKTPANPDIQKP